MSTSEDSTTATDARPRELLTATNVKKHFPVDDGLFDRLFGENRVVRAVDGVDLTVRAGETVGIVGESGSGKSTLGRTVSRLYEPTDGSITFDGEHIETHSGRELQPIRRRVQYVFQDPMSALNPRKTVGESVARPLSVHDIATGEEKWDRVADLFEEVGLSASQLDAYPHELSGGQRQRVGLCRALVTEPDLVVFDEPVSALDVTLQAQILNLINRLQREFDLSYLLISHDLNVVRQVCDRIAVMYAGEIVERGTARDIFENPQHPYTRGLLASIPGRTVSGDRLPTIGGEVPTPTAEATDCRFADRCPEAFDACERVHPEPVRVGPDHTAACLLHEEGYDHDLDSEARPAGEPPDGDAVADGGDRA